jgi:hypothetical protein
MRGGINFEEHGAPQQPEYYAVGEACQALIVHRSKIANST